MAIFPYKYYRFNADVYPETAFTSVYIIKLPIIEIKLKLNNIITKPLAVFVDSGATHCIFDVQAAKLLGIGNYRSGKYKRLHGIGYSKIDAYFFSIELIIDSNLTLPCYAGFVQHKLPFAVGLLGSYDFINNQDIRMLGTSGSIKIG